MKEPGGTILPYDQKAKEKKIFDKQHQCQICPALLFNQRFELLSLPQNIFFFSLVNPALKSQHQDGTLGSGETHNSLHWFGCVSSWSGDLWMKTLSVSPPATLLLLLYYTHTPYTQNNRALITAINISIWIMEGWGKHSTLSLIHNNSEILPGWL